jgi:uncharacterized protein (DUF2236 family)
VSDAIPQEVRDAICGLAYAAAGANVIMQLAQLPIGRAVALSTVESGRVDKHPVKRLRTTSAFLVISMLGTDDERLAIRREINRQHRQVKATEPVPYNAFDPQLQLWVAACLYKGFEDVWRLLDDRPIPPVLYDHGARFGTTLQVPQELWPADRAAFEDYWHAGVATIAMDDVSRPYLQGIAGATFLGPPGRLLGPMNRLLTVGFLPPPFQEELGLPWNARRQSIFDRVVAVAAAITRVSPAPLRQFPLNLYLADTRRRIRLGRAIV